MRGNCYEAAAEFVIGSPFRATLVHGTCLGTGGEVEGIRYGHAWVEIGNWCLDVTNGRRVLIPRESYYRVGTVEDVVRYDYLETARHMIRTGHYGPWDEANLKAA